MRNLATLISLVVLCSCSWSWGGRYQPPSATDEEYGTKSVADLTAEFESEAFWRQWRYAANGRTNALKRDLGSIWSTFDLLLFNYSRTDPYVNHPTTDNYFSAAMGSIGGFVGYQVAPWFPTR